MPETRRLFFALWPDAAVRAALVEAARHVPVQGRAVDPADFHITLAFLGATDAARERCCREAADRLRAVPFTLTLDRAGHWPRPQVLWLAPAVHPPALHALATDLATALRGCGFQPEARPFQPHLTLARKVRRAVLPEAVRPVLWPVGDFVLVESGGGADGVRYAVRARWPLGPA